MEGILGRKVLPETTWMVVICGLDTIYTLYAVRMGFAHETNPLLSGALQVSNQLFLFIKILSFVGPLVVLEMLRQKYPSLIVKAMRLGVVGYLTIYFVGSLLLLNHPV